MWLDWLRTLNKLFVCKREMHAYCLIITDRHLNDFKWLIFQHSTAALFGTDALSTAHTHTCIYTYMQMRHSPIAIFHLIFAFRTALAVYSLLIYKLFMNKFIKSK